MENRNRMGKNKEGVIFPVAPNLSDMSGAYLEFIEEIKKEIQHQRLTVVLNGNSSMICLYWHIGKEILQKQEKEGWGAKIIDRMSKDLKEAFPDMSGSSPRNIKYMRKFAACWPDFEKVQQVVAQTFVQHKSLHIFHILQITNRTSFAFWKSDSNTCSNVINKFLLFHNPWNINQLLQFLFKNCLIW